MSFGDEWIYYLYENLLGDHSIISEILTEFENNEKLGLIFPIDYYKALGFFGKEKNDPNIVYMNYILKKLSYEIIISKNLFDFPSGNMFWARVDAVYQIFEISFKKRYLKENTHLNVKLMNAVERIWLFIAKLNGYYYKKIYKHI